MNQSRSMEIILTSRPIGWLIQPLVIALGYLTSIEPDFPISLLILALLFTFPYNLILYGINDIFDYESDIENPRKGGAVGAVVRRSTHRTILYGSYLSGSILLVASLLIGIHTFVFTALLLVISVLYSAPPIRIKERPPFDSISNGFIYFLLPYLIGFSAIEGTVELPPEVWLVTLCAIAVHAVSTVTDHTVDLQNNVRTFSTKYGKRAPILFAGVVFIITLILFRPEGPILHIQAYLIITIIIGVHLFIDPSEERLNRYGLYFLLPGFLLITAISIFLIVTGSLGV